MFSKRFQMVCGNSFSLLSFSFFVPLLFLSFAIHCVYVRWYFCMLFNAWGSNEWKSDWDRIGVGEWRITEINKWKYVVVWWLTSDRLRWNSYSNCFFSYFLPIVYYNLIFVCGMYANGGETCCTVDLQNCLNQFRKIDAKISQRCETEKSAVLLPFITTHDFWIT